MIAEIHGKISGDGSNLSNQMEDKLTGDFFSILRYLPYEKGLKILLENLHLFEHEKQMQVRDLIKNQGREFVGNCFQFWPYHTEAEIDVYISLEKLILGIEVKYNSGLSSEDQLERELKVINDFLGEECFGILVFIARGDGIFEGIHSIETIQRLKPKLFEKTIFSYISWEDIYEVMLKKVSENLDVYTDYEQLMLHDIFNLLEHKGFIKFKNFNVGKIKDIDQTLYLKFDYEKSWDWSFDFNELVGEDYYVFR